MFTDSSEKKSDQTGELLALFGLNHRSAAVDIRERLAIGDAKKPEMLQEILGIEPVREAVVVSTCNRVELLVAGPEPVRRQEVFDEIIHRVARVSGVSSSAFAPYLYRHEDRDAVTHVFRVAAGLDSMLLGEPQVLGQLKDAYQLARESGAAKALLGRLFDRAFHVAKAVRTRTEIGQHAVSVCYAAKELSEQIFGDLRDAAIMLMGAGDMGTLALKHFRSAGASRFYIVNKTLSRACELAELCGGVPLTFQGYARFLHEADIVIGASALQPADAPLLSKQAVEEALDSRQGNPMFLIDMGVPRNFDVEIDKLSDVFLYNIDDLGAVVQQNLQQREHAAKKAELIVDDEVAKFVRWLELRCFDSSIRKLMARCRDLEESQIEKTMRRLERSGLTSEQQGAVLEALQTMAPSVTARLLHEPLTSIRRMAAADRSMLDVFERLFRLGPEEDE